MKYIAGIIISMLTITAQAQFSIKIIVTGLPVAPATDALFIAGNFNGWNPQDENFRLQKNNQGFFFIEIKKIKPVDFEFKFTRGGWDKAETDITGQDIANRSIHITSDTSLQFSIAGWKDAFAQMPKKSTASAQVSVIDTAFFIPQLKRTRRIWLYLPEDYQTSKKKYPVLYMHDGQNLFDNATAFAGEWGIDEVMNSLKNPCIVVGIDNGGTKRMTEYNPNTTKQFGKGEGKEYLAFIVTTLKPFIDKKYRTLKDQPHTWMAGSSMGGLISFYAGLYYPEVFGGLGVFSPSFWIAPEIKTQIKQLAKKSKHGHQKYYFYTGGAEDKIMKTGMLSVANELKQVANPQMIMSVNPQGKHNEQTWSEEFPKFYKWILQ